LSNSTSGNEKEAGSWSSSLLLTDWTTGTELTEGVSLRFRKAKEQILSEMTNPYNMLTEIFFFIGI
jgi:hypothetical protein